MAGIEYVVLSLAGYRRLIRSRGGNAKLGASNARSGIRALHGNDLISTLLDTDEESEQTSLYTYDVATGSVDCNTLSRTMS